MPSANLATIDRRSRRVWLRWLLVCALVAYWLAMFTGTHLPRIPQALADQGDKVLHICGYLGLAFLLLAWRATRGTITLRRLGLLLLLIAIYGAFDEVTQPLVGRQCDFSDWVADLFGAVLGILIAWPLTRVFLRDPHQATSV